MNLKGISPKKSLGQNFLIDRNIALKTVNLLDIQPGENILEIGPGTGALTSILLEKKCNLTAVEIDIRAIEELQTKFPKSKFPNFRLIHSDFKHFDISNLGIESGLKVIGNIPYYLSSEIFFKLFESKELLNCAVMTVQKELAHRLSAAIGTKDYGVLALAMRMCGKCSIEFDVSPTCFYPAPNVWSSVIKMDFSSVDYTVDNYFGVMKIIRAAYNQRRKMLSNSLKTNLQNIDFSGLDNESAIRLKTLESLRPERLEVKDFDFLYKIISRTNKLS